MNKAPKLRAWLAISVLAVAQAVVPGAGFSQTASVEINVSAQVTSSCSFNSSANALLSVTCSLSTPMAAAPVAATTVPDQIVGLAQFVESAPGNAPPKAAAKLCNVLASEQLENQSFNQFVLDIAGRSAGPARYFSTFEVCF